MKSEKFIPCQFSRVAVVFKTCHPYIYHNLAAVLMLEADTQGYLSFGMNALLLKKFLTQKPKKLPRMGMLSGALISALYDFYVLRDMNLEFNPQAYLCNLQFPDSEQFKANLHSESFSGVHLVFAIDVPSCFLNSMVTTFINLIHCFLRDLLGAPQPKVSYQILTFDLPNEIVNRESL